MITRYRYILFALYLLVVGYIVFVNGPRSMLTESSRDLHMALMPFSTTQFTFKQLIEKSFVDQSVLLYNLIGNMLLFVPFSFLLLYKNSRYTPIYVIVLAFVVSFGIECIQYFLILGITDIDDVLLNTIGACLGYGLVYVLQTKDNKTML